MFTNAFFTTEFPITPLSLLVVILLSILIGYRYNKNQTKKMRHRMKKAESDMINSHADLLELQKEYAMMELKLRGIKDFNAMMPGQHAMNEDLPTASEGKISEVEDMKATGSEASGMLYDNMNKKKAYSAF